VFRENSEAFLYVIVVTRSNGVAMNQYNLPSYFDVQHYNEAMLKPTDLILVCLIPSPRDLEIARLLGWYRIPLRTAPKVVAVDYLAFYQPSAFGERGGQIEFIAEVRGHELTTRGELLRDERDHPHANEEYFKIQLGGLEKLREPIRAENEQLYKTELPEADIPPEVLMALLGIREAQADYKTKERSNDNFD